MEVLRRTRSLNVAFDIIDYAGSNLVLEWGPEPAGLVARLDDSELCGTLIVRDGGKAICLVPCSENWSIFEKIYDTLHRSLNDQGRVVEKHILAWL